MTDTQSNPEIKKKPIYTHPKFIASVVAGVILLILIFQNWDMTTIEIFFWTATLPRSVFYLIFALIGFAVGWLVKRPKSAVKASKKAE